MKSVCFVFPHPAAGPTGGYKVVYEYANRLAADGIEVHIVYSGSVFWKRKSVFHKLSNVYRQIEHRIKGYGARRWFPLDGRIKEHLSLSMNWRHVPRCDRYVATSPYTAWYMARYPIDNDRRFYFIQGKEDWGPGIKSILEETYHAPLKKIVISKWLQEMLKHEYGEESLLMPNGFDFGQFRLTKPIDERCSSRVSMLWSDQPLKDCATGLKAIEKAKKLHPDLKVHLFGATKRPDNLLEWIEYTQQPTDEEHLKINNEAAIYLATSKTEGWGLTVGEAMACGQAVVCTDIDGYREMAEDGRNALLAPVGDSDALARAIIALIEDENLRLRLARQGYDDIQKFSIEESYSRLRHFVVSE